MSVVCIIESRLQISLFFFFQAEDGIRDLVRSRGLGDVYKRQAVGRDGRASSRARGGYLDRGHPDAAFGQPRQDQPCLLYTSDAADERSSVDLGGRRILKKKTNKEKKKKK